MAIARIEAKSWEILLALITKKFSNPSLLLRAAFATRGFRAIIEKFQKEIGPDGPWPKRSPYTQKLYGEIQSGVRRPPEGFRASSFDPSNRLLQLTGNLRKSIMPGSLSKQMETVDKDKLMVFSPVWYSGHHDEGDPSRNLPARPFMWLSDNETDDMGRIILAMATGEA